MCFLFQIERQGAELRQALYHRNLNCQTQLEAAIVMPGEATRTQWDRKVRKSDMELTKWNYHHQIRYDDTKNMCPCCGHKRKCARSARASRVPRKETRTPARHKPRMHKHGNAKNIKCHRKVPTKTESARKLARRHKLTSSNRISTMVCVCTTRVLCAYRTRHVSALKTKAQLSATITSQNTK